MWYIFYKLLNNLSFCKYICVPLWKKNTKMMYMEMFKTNISVGFPGGLVTKKPPGIAGDMGSIPGPGRSHMP